MQQVKRPESDPYYANKAIANAKKLLSKYNLNTRDFPCFYVVTATVSVFVVTDGNVAVSLDEEKYCAEEWEDFQNECPVLIKFVLQHFED